MHTEEARKGGKEEQQRLGKRDEKKETFMMEGGLF